MIGVGKTDQGGSMLPNWTASGDDIHTSSVCGEEFPWDTWTTWGAIQRDLYVLDHLGNLVLHQNVTDGLPDDFQNFLITLINNINSDPIIGDLNEDGLINIADVILIANIVLSANHNHNNADINNDELLDIIDVIIIINISLS